MRSRREKRRRRPQSVKWGEKGKELVVYTGPLPFAFHGSKTDRAYNFTEKHPRRWVDVRDLPRLVKKVGLDDLTAAGQEPLSEEDA